MNKNALRIPISLLIVLSGIILTLFRRWEPTGETWGYWLFARIFSETGKFIIVDRGALYTLYLNLFRWIGYPSSVTAEYIVSSLIVGASLIVLFRRYLGTGWAVFAAFLWLPFLQAAEPPVQKLALACSCFAVSLREMSPSNRFRMAASYALLGLSYMFRSTYMILIAVFAFWDIMRRLKRTGVRGFFGKIRAQVYDWPIVIMLALLLWFNVMQSDSPWNNVWFATSRWFPLDGKSLANAAFVHDANTQYIMREYGTYKDKDFYFTNKEIFGGARDAIGVFLAQPAYIIRQSIYNLKGAFYMSVSFTMLPRSFYIASGGAKYLRHIILLIITIPFVLAILYGAWRSCKSTAMALFLIANIFLFIGNNLSLPGSRYTHPLIPVLILAACWYGRKTQALAERALPAAKYFAIPVFLIFFSNGLTEWSNIAKDLRDDIRHGTVKIMEERKYSLKAAFKSLEALTHNSNGLLALEHQFMGAFLGMPIERIHDVWEIPPFARLGESEYDGLKPGRIDCVLVSDVLATRFGQSTNFQLRYEHYILPYINKLRMMGASTYNIKGFGKVFILPRSKI